MDDLTFTCPVCGADVPRRAKSCPDCGACEKSGWSKDQYLDGLGLPHDDFDYEEFRGRELGGPVKKTPKQILLLVVGILIIVAMALMMLRGAF